MKRWQRILSEHCNVEIVSDNIVKVINAETDANSGCWFDNYITLDEDLKCYIVDTVQQNGAYQIVDTKPYKSIYDYLGY